MYLVAWQEKILRGPGGTLQPVRTAQVVAVIACRKYALYERTNTVTDFGFPQAPWLSFWTKSSPRDSFQLPTFFVDYLLSPSQDRLWDVAKYAPPCGIEVYRGRGSSEVN